MRNDIVHKGDFSGPEEAETATGLARDYINLIVGLSALGFDIDTDSTSD